MIQRRLLPVMILLFTGTAVVQAEQDRTGKEIFNTHCVHCHAPGYEYPGTLQLSVTRGKDKGVLEERDDLNADYIRYIVRNGLRAMPPFKPTNITDKELPGRLSEQIMWFLRFIRATL